LLLIDELREMGKLAVSVYMDKIPGFEEFNPETCYCYWDILIKTSRETDQLRDVFIFVPDNCELTIENISTDLGDVSELDFEKLQNAIATDNNYHTHNLRSIIKEYYAEPQRERQAESHNRCKDNPASRSVSG